MLAMGGTLVGASTLLIGLLVLLFGHPRVPRWVGRELVAMLAVVPLTIMIALGLGYVLAGTYRLLTGAGHLYDLAVPLGVAIVVAAAWRGLGIGRRLRAQRAAQALPVLALDPTLVVGGSPPPQPPIRPAGEAA